MDELTIKQFQIAQSKIYDHIGFVEDWVPFVIDFRTEMYWQVGKTDFYSNGVTYSPSKEDLLNNNEENIYSDEIFHHRFYPKAIYEGEKYTGIIVDTHTDGNRFLAIFENEKKCE